MLVPSSVAMRIVGSSDMVAGCAEFGFMIVIVRGFATFVVQLYTVYFF
jgi:hypothetical protein